MYERSEIKACTRQTEERMERKGSGRNNTTSQWGFARHRIWSRYASVHACL